MALVASDLAHRGAECYLVPANLREAEVWAIAPDFVLFFCFRRGYDRFARKLLNAGIQFGLLDAEGGVWPDFESYAELLWDDKPLFKEASCVCMWGPRMAEQSVERGLFSQNQIVITGCPRFDMYHPAWSSVLRDSAGNGTPRGPRVLINTNLTEVNPRFASAHAMRRHFCEVFGWTAARYDDWVATQQKAMDETIACVRALAMDLPNAVFVLRPHPFEGTEIYKRHLSQMGNVEINESGPVQEQLYRARAVIQRSCTTAIEAGLAGIPAFSPQWIPTPAVMPMAEAASIPSSSYEDLRSNIGLVLSGAFAIPAHVERRIGEVIHDWFFMNDGKSHQRVSDAILACTRGTRRVDENLCKEYLYGIDGRRRGIVPDISRRVRYWLNLSPEWSFRQMRSVPSASWLGTDQYFSDADVRRLVDRIQARAGHNADVSGEINVALVRESASHAAKYASRSVLVRC